MKKERTFEGPSGARIRVHESVTEDRVLDGMERARDLEDPGICLLCGEDADGVEPDARHYVCEACEQPYVFGIEEILVSGWYWD